MISSTVQRTAWYEIRASGWVSMTGSVEFVRYKTSVVAGAKLNSAPGFAAKAKVRKVPHLTSSFAQQRRTASPTLHNPTMILLGVTNREHEITGVMLCTWTLCSGSLPMAASMLFFFAETDKG